VNNNSVGSIILSRTVPEIYCRLKQPISGEIEKCCLTIGSYCSGSKKQLTVYLLLFK